MSPRSLTDEENKMTGGGAPKSPLLVGDGVDVIKRGLAELPPHEFRIGGSYAGGSLRVGGTQSPPIGTLARHGRKYPLSRLSASSSQRTNENAKPGYLVRLNLAAHLPNTLLSSADTR
jgi:hypothetical protein